MRGRPISTVAAAILLVSALPLVSSVEPIASPPPDVSLEFYSTSAIPLATFAG